MFNWVEFALKIKFEVESDQIELDLELLIKSNPTQRIKKSIPKMENPK